MIRINLLPKKRQEVKREVFAESQNRYVFLGTLACSFAIVVAVFIICASSIESRRNQIAAMKQEIAARQALSKEFASLEKDKKQLLTRIGVINKIKEGRAVAPRLLYDLSGITKDNVWLQRVSKDEDKFSLEGRSVDNETLCGFVENLAKLPYMKNIELKSVEDITEANMTVKRFIVTGSVSS